MFHEIAQFFPQLMHGLVLTIKVAIAAFALGLAIALVAAPTAVFGNAIFGRIIRFYTLVFRGLPELLIIFMTFYGGTLLLSHIFGHYIGVDAFSAGVVALGLVNGSYLTEILRAAIQSIAKGQNEAARTLGLSAMQTFRDVLFPQVLAVALPPLSNQWLVVMKDSALVSLVGLEEIMRTSIIAAGTTRDSLTFYVNAAILYLAITSVSSIGIALLRRRYPIVNR